MFKKDQKNNYVYFPVKHKTDIRGFWKDKGKLYIDNIKKKEYNTFGELDYYINQLYKLGELAIFYTGYNKAFIVSKENKRVELEHKITWFEKRLKVSYVKALINQHGAITIYRENEGFKLELWK